jgi:hypothetical protein
VTTSPPHVSTQTNEKEGCKKDFGTLIAGGVVGVCSDLAIDFDEALGEDGRDFTLVQGVLEAVPGTSIQRIEGWVQT